MEITDDTTWQISNDPNCSVCVLLHCIVACTLEGFPAMVCVFVMPLRCKIPYAGRVFQIHGCFQRQTETVSPHRKDYLRCISNAFIQREGPPLVCHASALENENENEIQLKILDSYFDKLREDCEDRTARLDEENVPQSRRGLNSLEDYLERLNQESTADKLSSLQKSFLTSKSERADDRSMKRKEVQHDPRMSPRASQQFDEPLNLYLISIIASVNIAVFLFEIASPVKSSSLDLFTLPLLYGAKVNDLILVGEWWRLITPMFLHSGILHMGLGCWALATFGTRVCKGYGPFTFLLIYLLGGISGNLTSFLHTPDPTVGGTGPTFAMIGAWLIYQMQNKDLLSKDVSEAMFQRAIITTALTFILSNYGPIDDWTHLGAAVTGIIYGYFTCPTLQMDDASATSSSGPEEGISLVNKPADPCKSLLVFAFVILVFGCLIFFIEPPIGTLVTEDGFL